MPSVTDCKVARAGRAFAAAHPAGMWRCTLCVPAADIESEVQQICHILRNTISQPTSLSLFCSLSRHGACREVRRSAGYAAEQKGGHVMQAALRACNRDLAPCAGPHLVSLLEVSSAGEHSLPCRCCRHGRLPFFSGCREALLNLLTHYGSRAAPDAHL